MNGEVIIGVDAHKHTHTLVAVDALGRELGQLTVSATREGHGEGIVWAAAWPVRRWALEDCRHVTRSFEADLLVAGERGVRVPTKLMSGARRAGRERGKSDPIDALAVARAAWREADLPPIAPDGPQRQVKLLVDHRDDLVRERTRAQGRLRWHMHEIDPTFEIPSRGLRSDRIVELCLRHLDDRDGTLVEIAREILERIRQITIRARELEHQITILVCNLAPSLLSIPGCGALSAAKILGETAGASRFRSKSAYARWNGTAPQPVSSGNTFRVRLTRSGNRQVNAALHRIAVTQARVPGLGHDYLQRRLTAGNTRVEALRLLRRRLSDVVYRTLRHDEHVLELT